MSGMETSGYGEKVRPVTTTEKLVEAGETKKPAAVENADLTEQQAKSVPQQSPPKEWMMEDGQRKRVLELIDQQMLRDGRSAGCDVNMTEPGAWRNEANREVRNLRVLLFTSRGAGIERKWLRMNFIDAVRNEKVLNVGFCLSDGRIHSVSFTNPKLGHLDLKFKDDNPVSGPASFTRRYSTETWQADLAKARVDEALLKFCESCKIEVPADILKAQQGGGRS